MATTLKLKLTYFDKAGRAEATRIMFRLSGVPFEDERLPRETFGPIKSTLPYGHVPLLEVDGDVIAESLAIQRYVARITGFYPVGDPVAALMVDEVNTRMTELIDTKMVPILRQQDPQQKHRQIEALAETHLPRALSEIDARLAWMATYPLFRDAPSSELYVHEVAIGTFFGLLKTDYSPIVPASVIVGYPAITAVHDKVAAAIAAKATTRAPPANAGSSPTKLKLTYLDRRARGEFVRLALHVGGVPFEDERVTYEQVHKRAETLPYGQVPVLDIDGRELAQTFALLRYAGTLGGLYPADEPLLAAKIDELVSRVEVFFYKLENSNEEKDPAARLAVREKLLADGVLQTIFNELDKRIAHWKKATAFVFGETLTIADLAVALLVDLVQHGEFDHIPSTIADNCTELVAIHAAVFAHPRVQDWYATRGHQ